MFFLIVHMVNSFFEPYNVILFFIYLCLILLCKYIFTVVAALCSIQYEYNFKYSFSVWSALLTHLCQFLRSFCFCQVSLSMFSRIDCFHFVTDTLSSTVHATNQYVLDVITEIFPLFFLVLEQLYPSNFFILNHKLRKYEIRN